MIQSSCSPMGTVSAGALDPPCTAPSNPVPNVVFDGVIRSVGCIGALPCIVFEGDIRPSSSKSSGSKALVEEKGESEKTSAAFRRRVLTLNGDIGVDEGIAVELCDGRSFVGLLDEVTDEAFDGEVL